MVGGARAGTDAHGANGIIIEGAAAPLALTLELPPTTPPGEPGMEGGGAPTTTGAGGGTITGGGASTIVGAGGGAGAYAVVLVGKLVDVVIGAGIVGGGKSGVGTETDGGGGGPPRTITDGALGCGVAEEEGEAAVGGGGPSAMTAGASAGMELSLLLFSSAAVAAGLGVSVISYDIFTVPQPKGAISDNTISPPWERGKVFSENSVGVISVIVAAPSSSSPSAPLLITRIRREAGRQQRTN